jgi:hypothetical protein
VSYCNTENYFTAINSGYLGCLNIRKQCKTISAYLQTKLYSRVKFFPEIVPLSSLLKAQFVPEIRMEGGKKLLKNLQLLSVEKKVISKQW